MSDQEIDQAEEADLLLWTRLGPSDPRRSDLLQPVGCCIGEYVGLDFPLVFQEGTWPPPLDMLCPRDFTTDEWVGFHTEATAWLEVNKFQPLEREIQKPWDTNARLYLAAIPFVQPGDESIVYTKAPLGCPCFALCTNMGFDETVYTRDVMVLGIVALEEFQLAVARLFSYMVVNNAFLGVLALNGGAFFCKRNGSHLSVSFSSGATFLLGLGYILYQPSPQVPRSTYVGFDKAPLRHKFIEVCRKVKVSKMRDMIEKLEFLDFSDLDIGEKFRFFKSWPPVFRAKHKGKDVVIKARDLTCMDWDWEKALERTVNEVDVYMKLHKCQGIYIPRLLSFGFLRGGMFSYIMMSDERVGDVSIFPPFSAQMHIAVDDRLFQALGALHARGILHGSLEMSSVVISQHGDKYSVKLVGFSKAHVIKESERRQMVKENLTLEEIINLY